MEYIEQVLSLHKASLCKESVPYTSTCTWGKKIRILLRVVNILWNNCLHSLLYIPL